MDDLFSHVAQRRGFREYLAGRLVPRPVQALFALAGATGVRVEAPAVQAAAVLPLRVALGPSPGQ